MGAMARRCDGPQMRARPHLQSSLGANNGSVLLVCDSTPSAASLASLIHDNGAMDKDLLQPETPLQSVRNDFVRENQAGFGSKAALLKFMRRLVPEIARPQSIANLYHLMGSGSEVRPRCTRSTACGHCKYTSTSVRRSPKRSCRT